MNVQGEGQLCELRYDINPSRQCESRESRELGDKAVLILDIQRVARGLLAPLLIPILAADHRRGLVADRKPALGALSRVGVHRGVRPPALRAKQRFDRAALVHRPIALGCLLERQLEIEDLAGIDGPVLHELNERRKVAVYRRRPTV